MEAPVTPKVIQEQINKIPLLEQIVTSLKKGEEFHAQLGQQDFKVVIDQLMGVVLTSPDFKKMGVQLKSLPTSIVEITPQNVGKFYGRVGVASPVSADIQMWTEFANGPRESVIALAKCQTQTDTMIPFLGGKVDSEVKDALSNPNLAIFTALNTVLKPQGVEATAMGLHFADQKLNLGLAGKPTR